MKSLISLLIILVVTREATPRLIVSSDVKLFQGDTVRASSVGNITVVSYGFHKEAETPSWARKAFLKESKLWKKFSCSVEVLAVTIGPRTLSTNERRWIGELSVFDIFDREVTLMDCISAPVYGHPYPIPENLIPRTLALYCRNPKKNSEICPDLAVNSYRMKLSMTTGPFSGYSGEFEPRPLISLNKGVRLRQPQRVMVICICPLPVMDTEMRSKLQLWIAYHRQMGMSVALSVESTDVLSDMPVSLLGDEEITIYAPGLMTSVSYYKHVGDRKRGKYRAHFDAEKTLMTTLIRFDSRISRNASITIVMDFDEFLFAPRAPLVSDLKIILAHPEWGLRCDKLNEHNKMEQIGGLVRVVNGILNESVDSRAVVSRPNLITDIKSVSKLNSARLIGWPEDESRALISQGKFIKDIILKKFSCALDNFGYGIQIELPRADVSNENFSATCMTDNLASGKYSLHPCMEYMGVLQKGSSHKRSFKNKVLNFGQVSDVCAMLMQLEFIYLAMVYSPVLEIWYILAVSGK